MDELDFPRVPYLPQTRDIEGLGSVTIAHFRSSEVDEIYGLVCGSGQRGEDIGVDEYPTVDDWMERIREEAPAAGIVTVRDAKDKSLKAIIRFTCSRFSRSLTPCLAETKLVMAEGVRNTKAFKELVGLSAQLVKDCGCGFVGTTMESFIFSHDSIQALRANRFHITVMLPALIKHFKIGFTESVVFYKEFDTPLPEVSDMTLVLDRTIISRQSSVEAILADTNFPQMSFLPVERRLTYTKTPSIIRNASKSDVLTMYSMIKAAAERGEGYAVDEFPDLSTFIISVMRHYYSVILEDKRTGDIIGFGQLQRTMFNRTADCPVADCYIAIHPELASKGLGIDIGDIVMRCASQMGFKFMVNDTLVTHSRVINITRKMNYKIIGTVPNVSYVAGRGWEDCLYLLHDVGSYPKIIDSDAKMLYTKSDKINRPQFTVNPTNSKL